MYRSENNSTFGDYNLAIIKHEKILIIGAGGREHAIGTKIKNDNPQLELYFCPGNGGTQLIGTNLALNGIDEMLAYAQENVIDLTIVGPEVELVAGIVDAFQEKKIKIFGPNKAAAQLEGSKAFAKDFMQKYGVKTAAYHNFKHYVDAKAYLEQLTDFPVVIKASGLAAGKGVIIAQDQFDALETIKDIMLNNSFGEAGSEVVIEEFLVGFETSILSIFNGKEIIPFISAKDHKKIGEDETGLNTGGMGVIAPSPLFTPDLQQDFTTQILQPTLNGLLQEGLDFSGVIFFGLLTTEKGTYLLEYNMRFGDPETQTVLPLLENNLLEIIEKSIAMESFTLQWKTQSACTVVIASGGYPANYDTGFEIKGLSQLSCPYYIAGANLIDAQLFTAGGRVLNIVGLGSTLEEARTNAYENCKKAQFDYQYYRKDIGIV